MAAEPETRRQRLRRELTAEVITSAREQLSAGGPGGVTWRGIARAVGVNPASLYTYFDSLDDVFTAIILDSFQRLGEAIQHADAAHANEPPTQRILALALAYRQWALEHPAEFNLVFTDQIPGYAAPPDGPTVEAQTAIFGPFGAALVDVEGIDLELQTSGAPALPEDPTTPVALWATMHGMVMLEINHHLPFVADHEAVFTNAMRRALSDAER